MLQIWACHYAELKVALEMKYRIPIECELLQLCSVLQAPNVIELLDSIVRQEYPLQSRAMLQPVYSLDQVASEVELSEGDQAVQVLDRGDQVVRQIQHS